MVGLDSIKWKTELCHSGESCWCRLIVPVVPYVDGEGREWDSIIDSSSISKDLAEYIVDIHNKRLDNENNVDLYKSSSGIENEFLSEQLKKYDTIKVVYGNQGEIEQVGLSREETHVPHVRNNETKKSMVSAARDYFNNLFKPK